ncbi:MAG: sce7726 family protein [Lachnospiraceae bacterium]|nr:sce7726 family protein [Lachnospiraceae bacterium]
MLKDSDIRDELCLYLEETYGEVRFFDELSIGRSRADIVMITREAIFGIEIKSDADTYARLKRQVRDYNKYFDHNILVVGSTHATHAKEHVPKHWGILSAEMINGKMDFYELRAPQISPRAYLKNQLGLLWRRELSGIQERNRLHKYAGKRRAFVEEYVLSSVPEEELKKQVLEALFERDYTIFEEN